MLEHFLWLGIFSALSVLFESGASAQCLHHAAYTGTQSNAGLGTSVSAAGDVNDDGVFDILLSEPRYNGPAGPFSGRVRVRSGQSTAILLTLNGTVQESAFGSAVAGDANLDGDAHADVIVGASLESGMNGNWAGAVYAFSGVSGTLLWKRLGGGDYYHLGTSVAVIGDVNGDGRDDVLVGEPGQTDGSWTRPGVVYVLSGDNGVPIHTLKGDVDGDAFGYRVSAVEDIGGDQTDDLLVGAPWANGRVPRSGNVCIFSGATGHLIQRFEGEHSWSGFGAAVSGLGDIDGDGSGDVTAGAYEFGSPKMSQTGKVYTFSGGKGTLLWSVEGLSQGELSGHAVARAGDVNGDDVDDVIVGAYAALGGAGPLQGRVYLRSGLDGSLIDMWMGESSMSRFGWSVAGVGDVNQDGYDDVMVGAPDQTNLGGVQTGKQYLHRGRPSEDLNCDLHVNVADLVILIAAWGECAEDDPVCKPDVNEDDVVDVDDLLQLIINWRP
jgi:hypothetical protein